MRREGIQENDLRSAGGQEEGYPGAEVARFLGVTTSAVNKAANSEEVSSLKRYL
jgi:hypothetical protein